MAKQRSIIKLEGTLGDITFVRTQDGYLAKSKTSLSGSKIATDDAFQRTRENNAEFGRAGKACKLLRGAFRSETQKASDSRMVSRLTQQMIKVIQADETNTRGLRNVIDGEAELLQNFDFNIDGKLSTLLFAPFTATINRVTGELKIALPSFVPTNLISAPGGTTHFRIFAAGASIDFENEVIESKSEEGTVTPWNGTATAAIDMVISLTANSTHPLFLLMGIEFFQEVNGQKYSLKSGAYNASCIVKVDSGV